jgi:hypothetical protein
VADSEKDFPEEMETKDYPELQAGMAVVGIDDKPIGTVREVFRDIGMMESFGAMGISPRQPGHDPVQYGYNDGFPGAGDNYFTVHPENTRLGTTLYIPFSAVESADPERVILAVDSDDVEAMGWTVRPDALAGLTDEYPVDTGANPEAA